MAESDRVYEALVLAGRRGPEDALAAAAGAPHRALLDVGGVPMLERVVAALAACSSVGRIRVSIDAPDLLERFPGLACRTRRGELEVVRSEGSPSRSVLAELERLAPGDALFVTTADHALLRPGMVDHFLSRAETTGADVVVGLVEEHVLRARFPHARRTLLRFSGRGYSGANLFVFRMPRARNAATFWKRVEQYRKRPWRLVGAFGSPVALLRFLLGRLDLDAALARASRIMDARVSAVTLPFAEAAVDVDTVADLRLVREILARGEDDEPASGARAPGPLNERTRPADPGT